MAFCISKKIIWNSHLPFFRVFVLMYNHVNVYCLFSEGVIGIVGKPCYSYPYNGFRNIEISKGFWARTFRESSNDIRNSNPKLSRCFSYHLNISSTSYPAAGLRNISNVFN